MCVSVVRVLHAFIHVYIYIYIYTKAPPTLVYMPDLQDAYLHDSLFHCYATLYVCETIHNHWHATAHEINYRSLENISSFVDLS